MSVFHSETVVCPSCSASFAQNFANSVNADRRPDLRNAILDNSFQRMACPACNGMFRFAPHLTYLDLGRGQWILTMASTKRPLWKSLEAGALEIFNDAFGTQAPSAARSIGAKLAARVTFGWIGLREKLLCQQMGMNDVELELLKILLMRTIEAERVAEDAALRLLNTDPSGSLLLAWVRDDTEAAGDVLTIPRDLLDEFHSPGQAWDLLRSELANGPFVDATKLYVPQELIVAA